MDSFVSFALLVGAGFLGGAINAIAGGATFFTFPAMLTVGLPPVAANASNTVALAPASFAAFLAMRRYLPTNRRVIATFLFFGIAGGALGAWLVLWLGDERFRVAVPWLLLIATVMFALGPRIVRWTRAHEARGNQKSVKVVGYVSQALVGIYGGFFGAGMGMITLACMSVLGFDDLRPMNALKNLFTSLCNGVAIIVFVIAGAVSWTHAFVMMAGAVAGGYAGGHLGNRLPPERARAIVVTVGVILTVAYFVKS